MSTKNNPGPIDCYAKAAPDEPMFVLLGRDPLASILVRMWSVMQARLDGDAADLSKLAEANRCAEEMDEYATKLNPERRAAAEKAATDAVMDAVAAMVYQEISATAGNATADEFASEMMPGWRGGDVGGSGGK